MNVSALLSKIKEFTVAVGNMLKTVGGFLKDVANKLFEGIKAVFNWLKEHPAVATLLVACILSGVGYGIYSVGYKSAIAAGAKIMTSETKSETISTVIEGGAEEKINTSVTTVTQKIKSCVCNYMNARKQLSCLSECRA